MEAVTKATNRRGLMLAPIACMFLMAGCVATKSDVRLLRNDLASLQATQDSLYRASLRQAGSLADSVRAMAEVLRTTRGQLSNQIRQLQDMLVTVQELLGQSQQRINQLREQLERQQIGAAPQPVPQPSNPADAANLYSLGRTKLEEKSSAAARAAFEQFLSQYPQHERAPDAQLGLGEAFLLDGDSAEAVAQFERVSAAYPTSARAPEALYRAGEVSERLGRRTEARRLYGLIITRYADSPSARLARQRRDALR
ncbi:MAG: tol-pal system protein YbgF [Gemmatimonadota bacterium]